MIAMALLLLVTAVAASALFSGAETGLYRATRLRLVVDALSGDLIARGLLWLATHPTLFVATVLVGNSATHWLASLSVVLLAHGLSGASPQWGEVVGSLLLAPFLFVFGELVPKSFFLEAPNRLLRRVGPVLLFFTLLLLPISGVLWALSKLLERVLGQSHENVRTTLARRELRDVFEEGHAAGVLHPVQRALAQGVFASADRPVSRYYTPLAQVPRARSTMTRTEVLGLAQRYRIALVPVERTEPLGEKKLIGYVRVSELAFRSGEALLPLRPLLRLGPNAPQLAALTALHAAKEELAAVIDERGGLLGVVSADQLREGLF